MANNSINFPYFLVLTSYHEKYFSSWKTPKPGESVKISQKANHNSELRISKKFWDSGLMISGI